MSIAKQWLVNFLLSDGVGPLIVSLLKKYNLISISQLSWAETQWLDSGFLMSLRKFEKSVVRPQISKPSSFRRSDFTIRRWWIMGKANYRLQKKLPIQWGTGSLLIFSPLYRCRLGLIRAPLHFKKRDVIEMMKCVNDSDWPVIISLSAVTVALWERIQTCFWALNELCVFSYWRYDCLNIHSLLIMLNAGEMNAQVKELWGKKWQKTSGGLRCPDFYTAVPSNLTLQIINNINNTGKIK